jgi:hypothetical protein
LENLRPAQGPQQRHHRPRFPQLDPPRSAGLAGSSNDHHAWWAWGCHDPKGALAAAAAGSPDNAKHVAWGIGEFHPEWLREHFKELSEDAQGFALRGMAKWDDGQDPLAAMKFLKEIGRPVTKGTFQALIRQDPWAALDWAKENPGRGGGGFDYSVGDPMDLIVATMASDRPDDLERLAAQTPSGAAKLKMESAIFANLLKTDPQAALQAAKETTAPRAAAERYAAIGLGVVKTNPEQAFGLAKELLTKCPNAMGMTAWVNYPGGANGHSVEVPGVQDLLLGLMAKDPARTLEMTSSTVDPASGNSSFYHLASNWAQRDFVAYTTWVNRQTDPAIRDSGADIVVNNLLERGNFDEAADWTLSRKDDPENHRIVNLLANWKQHDATQAAAWLESVNMPEASKAKIRSTMRRIESHDGGSSVIWGEQTK